MINITNNILFQGKPHVKLTHNGEERLIPPEQISSEVLKEMKAYAEVRNFCENNVILPCVIQRFLNTNVTGAVITVPAYFDHRQRTETMRAAEIAELNVLRLINEPTAAAIAYMNKDKNELNGKTIMVFDLGGGRNNYSIELHNFLSMFKSQGEKLSETLCDPLQYVFLKIVYP